MRILKRGSCAAALAVALAAGVGPAAAADSPLIDAASHGNIAAVRTLLRQKADANTRKKDGETALHAAALRDDVEIARVLIASGGDVNAANDYGVTPLFAAALNGSLPMTELLLAAGANPNAQLPSGETSLMNAARAGRTKVVEALVRAGADLQRAETVRGQTALMWAVAENHSEVVGALLRLGADVRARSKAGFTPLMFAARTGSMDVARLLIAHGAGIDEKASDGSTALLVATVRGHVPLAMFFLERGADPNIDAAGYAPLHWAAGTWESIVTHDYHVADGEWSAMAGIPSRTDKVALITALLRSGANPNAVVTKDPPRYGFTLFQRQHVIGGTPFYLAALVADVEVMRLLVANGADPLLPAKDGTTPLMVAAGHVRTDEESLIAESKHLDAVKLALDLGADVNQVNTEGYSALHSAAYAGLNPVVQYLVDHGARLNEKDKKGQTPLAITEGVEVSAQIIVRPHTAALLRTLGATR
jgi:uncharacterized protein